MNVLIVLMVISIVLAAFACSAFYISARRGQFDDLDSPSLRVLRDDERV